jgi:hypothetical protein
LPLPDFCLIGTDAGYTPACAAHTCPVGEKFYHSRYFSDGSPIDVADLDRNRAVVERDKVMFPWQKHDVLLVENLLNMYGRSPFTDNRRILATMRNP